MSTTTTRQRSGLRLRTVLGGALLAALVLAALPGTADAGTYEVWSCRGPDGEPVAADGWTLSYADAFSTDVELTDVCAGGGALDLAMAEGTAFNSPQREARGVATFAAPPGAPIIDYVLWRAIETAAPDPPAIYDFSAAVRDRVSETVAVDHGCSTTGACQTLGDPSDPWAPANELELNPKIALQSVQLTVACAAPPCFEPPGIPARVRLFGARVVLDDVVAPDAPRLSGSLADPAPVSGPAFLVVQSDDEGGGVARATLSIDGGPPEVRASGGSCQEPYTRPQPCPTAAAHVFVVDTGELAEGEHTASGTVVDAGGNETGVGPLTFTVDHPEPPQAPPPPPPAGPANGTPAVAAPRLRLADRRVERRRGRPARIRGTLRTAGGTPIAGARLDVTARQLGAGAARARELAPVTTSARGRFAVRLRGSGAEQVSISFAPQAGAAPTRSATAVVRTRVALSLRRRPARVARGQAVVFRGRLRGAGAVARGAVVEMQAIVSGRWQTVATVRARRGGRYRWRYRFRYVDRRAIFSFRALIRHTPGWPWPTMRSRRIRVHVNGQRRAGRDGGRASSRARGARGARRAAS